MRTTDQMFGKVARDIAAHERAVAQDAADRERRHQEAEAHLDEPLTRREVLDALETVKARYSGQHGDATRGLLEELMEALR